MKPTISIGTQSFEYLREHNYFFIDKTDFIKEWWENGDAVTLITRPRRFGKTLNLDMFKCFFSNQYSKREDLFRGLSIWKDDKYRQLQGSYPVISISFSCSVVPGWTKVSPRKSSPLAICSGVKTHPLRIRNQIAMSSNPKPTTTRPITAPLLRAT